MPMVNVWTLMSRQHRLREMFVYFYNFTFILIKEFETLIDKY